MRIPTSLNRLVPSPRAAIAGLTNQTVGVVVSVAAQKYVPNVWARWAIYTVAAAMGVWYPLTKAVLAVTKADQYVDQI